MESFEKLLRHVDWRALKMMEAILDQAETASAGIAGLQTRREGDRLVMEGRGLLRRWLTDARIRFGMWGAR